MKSKVEERAKEFGFMVYTTDALKLIAQNVCNFAGGAYLSLRWVDLVSTKDGESQEDAEEDPRSCAEIAVGIWSKIRGE